MKKRAKSHRISAKKEIASLYAGGTRWACPSFTLIYEKNKLNHDRCAVIVSKANGIAVVRNRTKRIFRELFFKKKNDAPPYFDILIVPAGSCFPPATELQGLYISWKNTLKR